MNEVYDFVGIGVGPFNLSVAALCDAHKSLKCRFFEASPRFSWRSGMMVSGARLQTSFLKDLVTPVDPTSRYSFLSYLVQHGRFYRFLNAEFPRIHRQEFADYLRWVAEQLPSVQFATKVTRVVMGRQAFDVTLSTGEQVVAKHVIVGTGLSARLPQWARECGGNATCFHSEQYLGSVREFAGKRVVVVGGGQSGVEIFTDLMTTDTAGPSRIDWVTRRSNLEPLNESPFVNEYFTPDYVDHFFQLPSDVRARSVDQQKLAGDGASGESLQRLYQLLYERDFLRRGALPSYSILPGREVTGGSYDGNQYHVTVRNDAASTWEKMYADIVIMATGYEYRVADVLEGLEPLIRYEAKGVPKLRRDYSVEWTEAVGPQRLYILNGGRLSHGIGDPQLSLAAWRAAVVINSIAERSLYPVGVQPSTVAWNHG